ncbi:MAG: zinc ABC transporter substrate-binding protein [Solirubrobacterales bacterium]
MAKPLAVLTMIAALAASPARAEAPRVAASIQPLHSLVAAVMRGVAEPALVVRGAASEHTYALKPSDARMLEQAQLVVLVDPHYEGFLAKPLERLAGRAEIVAMADLPGISRLPQREGGVWEADEHGHGHDVHDGASFDGHLWLDPANAEVLVAAVAARLSALDPAHAATYAANARTETERLRQLDASLKTKLASVQGQHYVVFHDAYQYFEYRYGLTPAGAITVDPERPPSARRLAELRDRLTRTGATCVFREPQFPAPVVETLAKAAGARVGVLDPQGATLPPGPDLYPALMTGLADGLTSCLSGR